ncbi:MAG: hypothetical protein ACK4NV_11190 [Pannonibacter sp.]
MADETIANSFTKTSKHAAAVAAETFHDTSVAVRKTASDLSALAEAVQSDTKDGVRQLTHVVGDESSKVIGFIRSSIQERPNLTVGVAAGLGIVLGLMLSGRR